MFALTCLMFSCLICRGNVLPIHQNSEILQTWILLSVDFANLEYSSSTKLNFISTLPVTIC